MDQKPTPKGLFRLFNSGGKSKTHSGTDRHPTGTSFAQPLYSAPYPADPVTGPASSRSRSPATHWPGRNLVYARVIEPVDPGYTAPYPNHSLPVEGNDAGLYTGSQRLDASVGGTTRQLIIGIDFGTTSSGVAFSFKTDMGACEGIVTEWPGAGNQSRCKVPTVVYYDEKQRVVGWGLESGDALGPSGYPKPGIHKVEWFKMHLLSKSKSYLDTSRLPPLPPGKSAIDVAADYLFQLRRAMCVQLKKYLGETVFTRGEANIHYFLTVPAIWDETAKAATRAAAVRAGFLPFKDHSRLTLVAEPEAAAMFSITSGVLNLQIHDAVLVVDCGGGTVDLIAYKVEDKDSFELTECTAGSGDCCGSTAVNRNFSILLRRRILGVKLHEESRIASKVHMKCLHDFETRIKADFRNNGNTWAIDVGLDKDYPEAGIVEGYMMFTDEEILECFEPVVERVTELVRNQVIDILSENRRLQNVLVVGGFGASEYLFSRIRDNVPVQFRPGVIRPMDAIAAIVKGAVAAGISASLVTARVSRKHYLMATVQAFREGYHKESYRIPSLDGNDRCKNTCQIVLAKGQRITIGEPVRISFYRNVAQGSTLIYNDILYTCEKDVCPEYTTDKDIKALVTLTSDLSTKNLEEDFQSIVTPLGTFYKVYFEIYLTLDGSEFKAEIFCQGDVMGRCVAKFE